MTLIFALVIAAIVASSLLDLYLQRRQAAAVLAHRDRVPQEFSEQLSLAEHQRAADYTLARLRLAMVETLYDMLVTLLWLTVFLRPAYTLLAELLPPGLSLSVSVVIAIGAVGALLHLPFALVKTFWLEARFGFNRMTPAMFVLDLLKGAALQLVLGLPLLYGLFGLLRVLPNLWWLYAWAGLMLIMIAMIFIYPTFIAPLFNKFTPMADNSLRAEIEALLTRCGFASKGLFVMDASKRSAHGNAYFSGLGKAKRIVFFDTLLEKHTQEEILSILAHELGHYKFGHIAQRILQSAVMAFAGFAVLQWAFSAGGLAHAFGLPDDPGLVLMIVMFALGPVSHLLSPLTNFLSRRAEFQADAFAKSMLGAAPMISALTKLSRDNLSTLTPDRLYTVFYYSHPPVPVRIAHLKEA